MKCYTVGHSTYEIDEFIKLITSNKVDCIVDVRSQPYSKFVPQYNREKFKIELLKHEIKYIFMGNLLGARWTDEHLLMDSGIVDFEKVIETRDFKYGIFRLLDGIKKGYTIAIMCSEKEPSECHRFSLVSRELNQQEVEVHHILSNGSTISDVELMRNLIEKSSYEIGQIDLFGNLNSVSDIALEIYRDLNLKIGYKEDES